MTAILGSAALGQQMVDQRVQPVDQTKRVEPGIGDLGSGRLGLRALAVDQRAPTGFESVYQVQRRNPFGAPGQQRSIFFARVDAGVTAVFPRSVYAEGRGGLIAQIPPDTVFYIGRLPESFTPVMEEAPAPGPTFIDRRVGATGAQAPGPEWTPDPLPRRADPSIFGSEEFRQYRVGRLMQRAATGKLEF
ncbi:MAG: hypothetical protein WD749_06740 [Phycisphaerales bacterium]